MPAVGRYSEVDRWYLGTKRPIASSSDNYDFTSHSAKGDACGSRVRDHWTGQANNADRTHESSDFHRRSIVSANRERSRNPKHDSRISCQRSRGSAGICGGESSTEPGCFGSGMFHGHISTYAQGPDIQARRFGGVPANIKKPGGAVPLSGDVGKTLEFFDDRDDVGEWREEMHGEYYYYFG